MRRHGPERNRAPCEPSARGTCKVGQTLPPPARTKGCASSRGARRPRHSCAAGGTHLPTSPRRREKGRRRRTGRRRERALWLSDEQLSAAPGHKRSTSLPTVTSSFAQFPKRRGATGGGTTCGARSPLTAGPLLGGAGHTRGPARGAGRSEGARSTWGGGASQHLAAAWCTAAVLPPPLPRGLAMPWGWGPVLETLRSLLGRSESQRRRSQPPPDFYTVSRATGAQFRLAGSNLHGHRVRQESAGGASQEGTLLCVRAVVRGLRHRVRCEPRRALQGRLIHSRAELLHLGAPLRCSCLGGARTACARVQRHGLPEVQVLTCTGTEHAPPAPCCAGARRRRRP